jgi:peptide/nickel transport system substrate-binding protein
MKRREFLAGAASLTGVMVAGCTPPDDTGVLRAVLHADLQSLDPVVTTIGIVQRHAFMVYDFLFGRPGSFHYARIWYSMTARPLPQMTL